MTRFVLAHQPLARKYFRAMSPLGPVCTTKIREAKAFRTKAEALESEAMKPGGEWIFAPVEVK